MKIEKHDIITLSDNNEYVVVSKILYNKENYIYLVDIHKNSNFKYAKIENTNSLIILDPIKQSELTKKLIPIFYNDCKNDINIS